MARRANPLIVGIFVLGALMFVGVALFFVGGARVFTQREQFICYFQESVNGLTIGAPVKYKGVPIGKVKAIKLRLNQDVSSTHIPVIIEIETRLINQLGIDVDLAEEETLQRLIEDYGLRAQLQFNSIVTGYLFIALDYHKSPPEYKLVQREPPIYSEIPTLPSELQEFSHELTKIVTQLSQVNFKSIGTEVKRLLRDVNPPLTTALKNLSQTLKRIDGLTMQVEKEISPFSQEMQKTGQSLQKTSGDLSSVLGQFGKTLTAAERVFEPGSPERYRFDRALSELTAAAQALNRLADFLERNPNAVLIGRPPP